MVLVASLTYGIIEGSEPRVGSALVLGLFAPGAPAAAVLVFVETRRREPLIDLRFFLSAPFCGCSPYARSSPAVLSEAAIHVPLSRLRALSWLRGRRSSPGPRRAPPFSYLVLAYSMFGIGAGTVTAPLSDTCALPSR